LANSQGLFLYWPERSCSLIEALLKTIDRLLSDGRISWGAVITALLFFNKIQRNKEFRLRDQRVERNQQRIMAKLGVEGEWASDLQPRGLKFIYLRLISFLRPAMKHPKLSRRMNQMREYLKKLGSRKFQAFLIITVTNIIMLTGYLLNVANIQDIANQWMPVINLGVQAITTIVYQIVQGGVDKEAQKQQVYIVPSSDSAIADPAPPGTPAAADLSFDEIMAHVEKVNHELNECLKQIKAGDSTEIPKAAVQLYMDIHDLIKRKTEEP
jgi:hypothetical protein